MAANLRRMVVLGPSGTHHARRPARLPLGGQPPLLHRHRARAGRACGPTGRRSSRRTASSTRAPRRARRPDRAGQARRAQGVLTLYRFPTWANGTAALTPDQLAATMPDRKTATDPETKAKSLMLPLPRRRVADERLRPLPRRRLVDPLQPQQPAARPNARRGRRLHRGLQRAQLHVVAPAGARAPTRPTRTRRARSRSATSSRGCSRRRSRSRRSTAASRCSAARGRRTPPTGAACAPRTTASPSACCPRSQAIGFVAGAAVRVVAPQLHRRDVRPGGRLDLPRRGDRPDTSDEPRRRHAPAPRRPVGGVAARRTPPTRSCC